jgi:hypothetical protein
MSEHDSTSRRRAPTIDLTATEVENAGSEAAAKPAGAETVQDRASESAPPPSRGTHAGGFARVAPYAVGVLGGALVVAVIVAALWAAGFGRSTAPPTNVAAGGQGAPSADTTDISNRLDKIQQALQSPRVDEALAARLASTEAQTKSLAEQFGVLNRRVDEVAATTQSALAQAKAASAAADAAKEAIKSDMQSRASHADIDALTNRVAELENAFKSLSADAAQKSSASSADDRATRATVAAEALRSAIDRGAPFRAELAAAKALGADASAIAPLEPFAADGVPTASSLGHELAALVPTLQRAAEPALGGSYFERMQGELQRLVRITRIDASTASAGDSARSIIGRIGDEAARADITAALSDLARLPDAARAPAEGWIKQAQSREAAIAASRRIVADALGTLAKPVSQ